MNRYVNLDCAGKGPAMSPDQILSLALTDVAYNTCEAGDTAGDAILAELRKRGRLLPADPAKERRPLLEIFRDAMAWGRAYAKAIPSHQWGEMRDSKAAQYIAELGAPPQLADTFDKDDAKRLHDKVTVAIEAEKRSGIIGMVSNRQAMAAITTIFTYFHDRAQPPLSAACRQVIEELMQEIEARRMPDNYPAHFAEIRDALKAMS